MKKIIICEGHNDGLFIKSLMKELGFDEGKINIFNQKNVSTDEKKHAETNILRSFLTKNAYNPYDLLVKLEGGKDSAITLFVRELIFSLNSVDNLILILDMDQSNFDSKKRLIEKKVNESFGQTTALDLKFVEKKKNEILHHSSCKVSIKNSRDIGEFQMILFNPTFEKCCQIVKRKDNDNAKINKIEKFIKQNKLKDFFSQVI